VRRRGKERDERGLFSYNSACYSELRATVCRFALHTHFSEAEFAHVLLPRPGVVDAFVVEDAGTGAISGMASFYHLPSTVLGECGLLAALLSTTL
jgi:hypothetical protein